MIKKRVRDQDVNFRKAVNSVEQGCYQTLCPLTSRVLAREEKTMRHWNQEGVGTLSRSRTLQ